MSKYIVETFYTCTFKITHKLENKSVLKFKKSMDPKGFTTLKLTKKDPKSKIF